MRCSDILESVRFYTEVLGMKEAFRMSSEDGSLGTVYVYIGPGQFLELFANGVRPVNVGRDGIGLCHICLATEDIYAEYETLKARGAVIDREISRGKSKCLMFWTHDPDGNPLEIMELTADSLQAEANRRFV